ncbi:hypothetical protein [Alteromonas oceanisediminis]|uniref:hypothetical protein n=1 Tax=Alteromonas oceanisediminis TaxID=2836180 RepID=UPI001BDAD9DD|nr:hypothetical protein [Alteromonas oceanisediminis]MBT0585116.1 hypothetical protein [Alteromonas oceanisediminis]
MAKIGRPTKMTDNVIRKLEDAFMWGCSDSEACVYAGIGTTTLYSYCELNTGFRERKEVLKSSPQVKAKRVVFDALKNNDLTTANKVLDRATTKSVKDASKVYKRRPSDDLRVDDVLLKVTYIN